MLFRSKLDNLFRSIRVSDENSSVARALQCFLNLFEIQPIFAFNMHHSKRHHQFPTRSDIICCFESFTDLFRELNDGEIENHYKMNSEYVEHGMVSSVHPHSMCKRVERVTAKTGRTSCTNWTISFGVSGFRTRTHL